MNRDDIIRMAREAGIGVEKDLEDWHVPVWHLGFDYLVRFAALVAAAEREACAKVCDEVGGRDSDTHAWDAAVAIRARREK